jgi:hypothetical protein
MHVLSKRKVYCLQLYNNQHNAQTFNVSIYFCLTRFWLCLSPSSEAGVQIRQWF